MNSGFGMAWSTPGHIEADDPGERVDGAEVRGRFTCSCDEIGFSSVFFLGEGESKSMMTFRRSRDDFKFRKAWSTCSLLMFMRIASGERSSG